MDFTFLLLVSLVLLCIYHYLTRNYNYWKNQNVPSDPNVIPGVGHLLTILTLRENLGSLLGKLYRKMGKNSMYGCYFFQTPALMIRDPNLIESVLQRNFQSFRNNMITLHRSLDPIGAINPFFAKDEIWKESRSLLSHNFTSIKRRYIFSNVLEVWKKIDDYLVQTVNKQNKNAEFELKELFSRVVSEIVANSAFGIDGESFEDKPHYYSFFSMVQRMIEPTAFTGMRETLRFLVPTAANLLGLRFIPKEITKFTKIQLRKFFQSVIDGPETKKDIYQFSVDKIGKVEEDLIMAQATSIMYDGYETMISVLSFTIYRLAVNPVIQEKARREVNLVVEENKGTLTFESLKNLSYLDQVIYEALRMNPVFYDIMKRCNEEITLQGYDGLTSRLKPGDILLISTESMHMDEEFWPNPSVFDPERFNPANKDKINRFTYLAFGEGPRICPGKRMGLMIVKALIALILQNYNLIISEKSEGPLKKDPTAFMLTIEGGLWVHFVRLRS